MSKKIRKYPIVSPPLPMGQRILHAVLIIIGWLIYFYFFWRGIIHGKRSTLDFISLTFSISLFIFPIVSYSWIVHNINIFKEKGPRKATPYFPESYDKDFLNTPVIADWEKMKQAKIIVITVTPEEKVYTEKVLQEGHRAFHPEPMGLSEEVAESQEHSVIHKPIEGSLKTELRDSRP